MVWDKGGSGLVFYTDAAYWDQQDGGMFALLGTKLSHTLQYLAAVCFFLPVQILMKSVQKRMIGMWICLVTMTVVG